jgi:hypothetical protein
MTKSNWIRDSLTTAVVHLFGWAFCTALLVGAYGIGVWVAPYLGWTGSREIFGLLSAVASAWMYEHYDNHHRSERAGEKFDDLVSRLQHSRVI